MQIPNTQGQDLYCEVIGEGPPLLLLPGAGQSSRTFVETGLADLFASRFRVILMDVTGMGLSDRVTAMKPSQWSDDVVSVLDAVGVERAHLAGSSLGARVAARVAADHPGRVETLLVDMPITSVDEGQERWLHEMFSHYADNHLADNARRWHGPRWREAMDFFVAARRPAAFREFYTPATYLADIPAPTLVCRGDADSPVHPLSMATDWHRSAQRSWLWIEPAASNPALTLACPERVVSYYARFVEAFGTPA